MRKIQLRLTKIVRKFDHQTVGILGDFMLDELLCGEATRISPEAPVPVVLMDGHASPELFPGGAGRVAASVQALGGRPISFGAIGTDESGRQLCNELQSRGISCDSLIRERERITPRRIRIAAHQHQLLRLDFENPAPISSKTAGLLAQGFARWAPKLNALVISDYQKGSVQNELCNEISAIARQRRIPVFVDPKPEHPEICRHATAVTPSLREAELMAGRPMQDRTTLDAAGRQLLAMLDCSYVLINQGAEGMTLIEKGGRVEKIKGVARPASDGTGVRDTVLAVLALAFSSGTEMQEAAELANVAAGQVALTFGASGISRPELLKALARSAQGI